MINIKEFKNNINKANKDISKDSNKDVKNFIEKMFEARQVAHNHHLKTRSYSEHKALNGFYDGILDFVDDFTETYQGQYGLIESPKVNVPSVENIVDYLEDFCKTSTSARAELKDGHLQNIVDEILSLTYKTIYKLKYLK
jgi:hypothetical protein